MRRGVVACGLLALSLAPPAAASTFVLELTPPRSATHGDTITLRGRIAPALAGAAVSIHRDGEPIGTTTTAFDGTFAFRTPAERPARYAASAGQLASAEVLLEVRPRLVARVVGTGLVGYPLRLDARIEPVGPLRVEVERNGRAFAAGTYASPARVPLPTRTAATFRLRVSVEPSAGWLSASRALSAAAVLPTLAVGAKGPSVRALEARLRALRYALPRVDSSFGRDTYEAVLAFQKLSRLPWTGRVDARVWRALRRASIPRARHRGDHIEVSKGRQYLLVVRGGHVQTVVHVSTGATGNTPIGRWRVYKKVAGWDWVLWYPMYFLRGFAIHGYPSVPGYPASHGCVRVPMWIAPQLHATTPHGRLVYVYW